MNRLEAFLNAQKKDTIANLKKVIDEQKGGYRDFLGDRRWKPEFPEKSGSVEFVLRFLPGPDPNDLEPYQVVHRHTFKHNGNTFDAICRTTLKGESNCPLCNENTKLYNNATKIQRESPDLKKRYRNTRYYSNVLVVKDSLHPENNGKVFVYEMPKTVFGFIQSAVEPKFESDKPFDPFNVFDGKNLHVKCEKKGGYWKYDATQFVSESTPVTDHTDLEIADIFEQLYDIHTIPDQLGIMSVEDFQEYMTSFFGRSKVEETFTNPNTTMASKMSSTVKAVPEPEASLVEEEDDATGDDDVLDEIARLMG